MGKIKALIALAALAAATVGGYGVYLALINQKPHTLSLSKPVGKDSPGKLHFSAGSARWHIDEFIYLEQDHSEGNPPSFTRIFVPLYPSNSKGREKAKVLVETREPKVLELAAKLKQAQVTGELNYRIFYRSHLKDLRPVRKVQGMRAGHLDREYWLDGIRRSLVASRAEVDPEATLLVEGKRLPVMGWAVWLAGGLVVLILLFVLTRKGPSPSEPEEEDPETDSKSKGGKKKS